MIKVDSFFQTDGSGYWSSRQANVRIISIDIRMYSSMPELLVIFDRRTWRPQRDGLIYSDKRFMRCLRAFLREKGILEYDSDVDYSEQGMQGDNYVSCDVSVELYAKWRARFSN